MKDKKRAIKDKETVQYLFNSHRGHYIISQALYEAIKAMEARPKRQQEPSNVSDMKLMMNHLFPIYPAVEAAEEIHKIMQSKPGHIPEEQTEKYVEEVRKKKEK